MTGRVARTLWMVLPKLALALMVMLTAGCGAVHQQGLTIDNPYAAVDWQTTGRYKANLHTHTTVSDGSLNPHEVVDRYRAQGYTILAITDHNEVTYPWQNFSQLRPSGRSADMLESGGLETTDLIYQNRDPQALGMVDIQGNELSSHHHTGSFFSDHNHTTNETASFEATAAKGGLTMFYHPGRYHRGTQWYVDFYSRYPHLFGMEVYNQGNRYPGDRTLWDNILTQTMPDRPVWGYSNDDMHSYSHLGRNWSIMLLTELSQQSVRHGLEQGLSYFVYSPHRETEPLPPVIDSIAVDHERGGIRIRARNYQEIQWISDGRIIHTGSSIDLARNSRELGNYVRAKLVGANGSAAGTQPFGLRWPVSADIKLLDENGVARYTDEGHVAATINLHSHWGESIRANVSAVVGDRTMTRGVLELPAGGSASMEVPVPVEAINSDQSLRLYINLPAEFGRFRQLRSDMPLRVPLPVSLSTRATSIDQATISIVSQTDRPIDLQLVASVRGRQLLTREVRLEPGERAGITCPLPEELRGQTSTMQVVASWDRSFGLSQATFPARIDLTNLTDVPRSTGKEEDGDRPLQIILNSQEDVFPVAARDGWQGPQDLSTELHLGWQDENLTVEVRVRDDVHINTQSGDSIWSGDCVQLAVVPPAGTAAVMALALTTSGLQFHQWSGADMELADKAQYQVTRDDDSQTTHYRLLLPLKALGLSANQGEIFGFNIVIFDGDQPGRQQRWMQLSPGLAGGRNLSLSRRFVLGD